MPIYEYKCKKCEHKFEIMQKFSDAPLTKCPHCDTDNLKKCISTPNFQLKGTGWYETDYKKKPKSSEPKKEEPKKE